MKKLYNFNIKNLTAAFLLLYFFSNSSTAQPITDCNFIWMPQASGTTQLLYSVKAVSDMICWTAGANGTVRKTTDGGTTWENGNPNPGVITGHVLDIEAMNENNAWATSLLSTNSFIYKTTNGGNNWVQVYSLTGNFMHGIHMISPAIGFAFGSPVANKWNILVTSDGGSNWTLLPTAPTAEVAEQGFRNSFYVSHPYMWFGAFFGNMYRTTNNGINWTSHLTTGINTFIFAVHFNSYSLGLASSIAMVKTTDGGFTFSPQPVPGLGNINGIEGAGNNFWYIRGTNIYRSTDSGNNWSPVHTTADTQLDIDFPDNMNGCLTGWSVGHGGSVTKMTGMVTGTGNNSTEISNAFELKQNYPNPFNPVTNITYSIPKPDNVKIIIYDVLSREVQTVVNEFKSTGTYEVQFNASHLAGGLYFYKMVTADYSETKLMVLVK